MDSRHSYYLISKRAMDGMQDLVDAMQEAMTEVITRSCRQNPHEDVLGPSVSDFYRKHGKLLYGIDADDPDNVVF